MDCGLCEARNETRDLDLPDDLQQKFQKKFLGNGKKGKEMHGKTNQLAGGG